MSKRNLVLTSAVAALVAVGMAANSASVRADEPVAGEHHEGAVVPAEGDHGAAPVVKKKGGHAHGDKASCKGKDGCGKKKEETKAKSEAQPE